MDPDVYIAALEEELEQHRHQAERAKAIRAEITRAKKAAKRPTEKAVEGPPETAAE